VTLERIASAFDYLLARFGIPVTYRRFKGVSYDPDTGTQKEFWETTTFRAIVYSASTRETPISGGVISDAEAVLAFRQDVFTQQPDEPERPSPKLGDEIEFHGQRWTPAEVSRRPVLREDPTKTLFFLGVKRDQGRD